MNLVHNAALNVILFMALLLACGSQSVMGAPAPKPMQRIAQAHNITKHNVSAPLSRPKLNSTDTKNNRSLNKKVIKITGHTDTNGKIAHAATAVSPSVTTNFVALFRGPSSSLSQSSQPSGKFAMLLEQYFDQDGRYVRDGRILYAQLDKGKYKDKIYLLKDASGSFRYYNDRGRLLDNSRFLPPLKGNFVVTSKYGMRKHPITGKLRMHKGVDLGAPRGTKVYASADATVEFIGYNKGYGNYIKLNHGGKHRTVYAHLKGFASNIKVNQKVSAGQHIGFVGNTGAATGNHLHYEIVETVGSAHTHADPLKKLMMHTHSNDSNHVIYHDMKVFRDYITSVEGLLSGTAQVVSAVPDCWL